MTRRLPHAWGDPRSWPNIGPDFVYMAAGALKIGDALHGGDWPEDVIKSVSEWLFPRLRDGSIGARLLGPAGRSTYQPLASDWFGTAADDHARLVRCYVVRPVRTWGDPERLRVFLAVADLDRALRSQVVDHTPEPTVGNPMLAHHVMREFASRVKAGTVSRTTAAEARALAAWYAEHFPFEEGNKVLRPKSIEPYIRDQMNKLAGERASAENAAGNPSSGAAQALAITSSA